MALCRQIVNLVRLDLLNDMQEVSGVRQIAIMQDHLQAPLVRILIEVIDTVRVQEGRASLDPMNDITLIE